MIRVLEAEARVFDDAALAALGSTGLLRRAAKLVDAVAIDSSSPAEVIVTVGPERVTFTATVGLVNGTCTCPTVGPCQHLIAAIIAVRDRSSNSAGSGSAGSGVSADVGDPGLLTWILSLSVEEIRRFAGTAALRWAQARVDVEDVEITDGAPLVVRPATGFEVRFMGTSLDAAFCSPAGANDRRYIALAVLAVRSHHGSPLPAIATAPVSPNQSVARGGLAVANALLAATRDAVGIGIAHPSAALVERFESLAVDARGANLYRLGGLAATIATQIEEATGRHVNADPATLLADLSLVHVLSDLVVATFADGTDPPSWLRGIARAEYSPIGAFDALGLGAHSWTTRSGHSGVTAVLFDRTHGRLVEVSAARPNLAVRPGQRDDFAGDYRSAVGWSGGTTLASLSGKRLHLSAALMSQGRRLSTSSKTTATVLDAWTPTDLAGCEWDGTLPAHSTRLRGEQADAWVVLKLDEVGEPAFDEIDQAIRWPLRSAGHGVTGHLPWSARAAQAIAAVEGIETSKVSHLIGRLRMASGGELVVAPVSVVAGGHLRVLAFDPMPEPPGRRLWSRRVAPSALRRVMAHPQVDPIERLGREVLNVAERGADSAAADRLERLAQSARAWGWSTIADVLADDGVDAADRVLRAAHLVEEHHQHASTVA